MVKAEETWREEIDALRAEIEAIKAQRSTAGESSDEAAADEAQSKVEAVQKSFTDMINQANEAIGDLQRRFSEGSQTAEETVSQHPIATLASAFLLGLVIGRVSR